MGKPTRIYKKETLEHSWNNGSTMWVIHGDGIRVFTRNQCGDFETLFNSIKTFIEDRKYEVYAN